MRTVCLQLVILVTTLASLVTHASAAPTIRVARYQVLAGGQPSGWSELITSIAAGTER